jgi:hypothetical protein
LNKITELEQLKADNTNHLDVLYEHIKQITLIMYQQWNDNQNQLVEALEITNKQQNDSKEHMR